MMKDIHEIIDRGKSQQLLPLFKKPETIYYLVLCCQAAMISITWSDLFLTAVETSKIKYKSDNIKKSCASISLLPKKGEETRHDATW